MILEQLRRCDSSKASGSFLVTNRLLKIARTAILYPLSRFFSFIISRGQYPTAWKQADVVPMPKEESSQFRPISLLPPISKLFEEIVASHLTNYLNRNGLLSYSQYSQFNSYSRFRQQRSTGMRLIHMAHQYNPSFTPKRGSGRRFLGLF
ncbi:hypothetical protein RvY_05510 [Ramazzottius varieornatus]|uniref:Reverse transcriptase domain-containing protein n=1 Tax=Ramazzottius varieornatus TaxID=947166 RepID=A0A1D1UVA8_RAMVA|nr:hypothetical protein RvY_05510 [Ramazzottius varieornatus]